MDGGARSNFSAAVQAFAAEVGMEFTPLNDEEMTPAGIRYRKLHEAVGHSVMLHHFGAGKLPSKEGVFDWSLGPGVREIAEKYDADYALFASYRDEVATGKRLALSMLAGAASAAATGVALVPKTDAEFGFASLVDLRTGEIVWLNVVRSGTGELRKLKWARTAVDTLFKDMP